jgi:Domain of unknown function (DUF4328)
MALVRHRRAGVWTWLGWCVPVVSFWFPYQVLADILRASDPDQAPQESNTSRATPAWLWGWWLPWVAWILLSNAAARYTFGGTVLAEVLRRTATVQTIGAVLLVIAGIFFLRLVGQVQSQQALRAGRLNSAFPGVAFQW